VVRRAGFLLAVCFVLLASGRAAYPGRNGKIAFVRNPQACNIGCEAGGDIWVMDAIGAAVTEAKGLRAQ